MFVKVAVLLFIGILPLIFAQPPPPPGTSPCPYYSQYSCDDQLDTDSVCLVIFNASNPNNGTIDPKCSNQTYAATALQCAYTCGACCSTPEYNCQNAPAPNPINCNSLTKEQCKQQAAQALYAQYCPATCGLCTTGSCANVIDCTGLSGACFIAATKQFMCTNCANTCGCSYCGIGSSTASTPIGGVPGTGTCADTSANCATWKSNGFCTSTFYTSAQKQQYCGNTCGLCG